MKIAVSMSCREDRESQDCLNQSYVSFLLRCGCSPLLVPNAGFCAADYAKTFGACGLLLTGGHDWTEAVDGKRVCSASTRDRTERNLVQWALTSRLPIVGICRGFHLLNVFFGGRVEFAVDRIDMKTASHVGRMHVITLQDSCLQACFGACTTEVNSFHENCVRSEGLAAALMSTAICAADGIIESFRHREFPVYGVQWHPERPGPNPLGNHRMIRRFFCLDEAEATA